MDRRLSAEHELAAVSGATVLPPRGLAAAWTRLLNIASSPQDGPEERLQKRLQIAMAAASVVFVAAWGGSFFFVGRPDAAVQCVAYSLGTAAMLGYLAVSRRYDRFRWQHPLLVVVGPYLLHLHLGGFAASGGAVLWSLIAPVAAMMFVGPRQSLLWVWLLVAMLAGGVVRELWLPSATPLKPEHATLYFAFNASGMVFFLYFGTRYFTGRVRTEQERADRLLLNILPRPIADRLKRHPGVIAERFESVTVVFADLVGFTGLSQRMEADKLVELLDAIFSELDVLADRHGLEKIKTIGDAYMVVAGLPEPCADHAERAARMALSMRAALQRFAADRALPLSMRIGMHSGPVVAGVIGQRKFSYDLWGDTVNTASRMESHGEPGRIQLSDATRAALGEAFQVSDRGTIPVKGKGEMHTWWLD